MRTEKADTDRLYTYEDYLKIDDDNQYELIGGKLILVPALKPLRFLYLPKKTGTCFNRMMMTIH